MKIDHKALLLAYTKEGKLIMQDRSNIAKTPRMPIGFWGGGVEEDETAEVALMREIKEELNLEIGLTDIMKFGDFRDIFEDRLIFRSVFLYYWTHDPESIEVGEGKAIIQLDPKQAEKQLLLKGDKEIVKQLQELLNVF